jgi:hypothetical protein
MPRRYDGWIKVPCSCCPREIVYCQDPKHGCKKTTVSSCCAAPICGEDNEECSRVCQFCRNKTESMLLKKSNFPLMRGLPKGPTLSAFAFGWFELYECLEPYRDVFKRPGFREFLASYQHRLHWHDHLRLSGLFNQYLHQKPSLQLALMFRMHMHMQLHMHRRSSIASVFGKNRVRIIRMLDLCRANRVRVSLHSPILAHFGFAFLCAIRVSSEFRRQKSKDASSVVVCPITYWRMMFPSIFRRITRLPPSKK